MGRVSWGGLRGDMVCRVWRGRRETGMWAPSRQATTMGLHWVVVTGGEGFCGMGRAA